MTQSVRCFDIRQKRSWDVAPSRRLQCRPLSTSCLFGVSAGIQGSRGNTPSSSSRYPSANVHSPSTFLPPAGECTSPPTWAWPRDLLGRQNMADALRAEALVVLAEFGSVSCSSSFHHDRDTPQASSAWSQDERHGEQTRL